MDDVMVPKLLRIEGSQSVAAVEALYGDLEAKGDNPDVKLPTQLHDWRLGGKAALIQFLITWSRRYPAARLVTYVNDPSDEEIQLENLSRREHGLVGLLLAHDVVDVRRENSVRATSRHFLRRRLEDMYQSRIGATLGPDVFLLCADHTSRAHISALYYPATARGRAYVRGSEDFRELTSRILKYCTESFRSQVLPIPPTDCQIVSRIIRELFNNTHQWARGAWGDRPIGRSVRGIMCQVHPGKANLVDAVSGSKPLEHYLANYPNRQDDRAENFIELSVFDSGPGLAQRWLNRTISDHENVNIEYSAVLSCLTKHGTSSGASHRGLGIHSVMEILSRRRGFFRLRTGRLSLFRDFAINPYTAGDAGTNLFDWTSGSTILQTHSRVEGSLWTLIIPLETKGGTEPRS